MSWEPIDKWEARRRGASLRRQTPRRHDLAGQRFGSLTCVRPVAIDLKSGGVIWMTRCDCGAEQPRAACNLKHGSFGCLACRKPKPLAKVGKR